MLSDFKKEKLESLFVTIMDYSCVELPFNVTRVRYYEYIYIPNAIMFGNHVQTDYKEIYFDSSTKRQISKEEAQSRKYKKSSPQKKKPERPKEEMQFIDNPKVFREEAFKGNRAKGKRQLRMLD